jgi:predicted GNAT family acetyltransferase
MAKHPLDRPVWRALTTRQSALALGDGRAVRLSPDYGLFAAAADAGADSLAALGALLPAEGVVWSVEAEAWPPPPGGTIVQRAEVNQMVAEALAPPPPAAGEVVRLCEADAAEMRALALLTEPGPFFERTHQLGDFVGIRHGGVLAAMAGERLRPEGFTEVSGVCTHPDHRGRGHAAALTHAVAQAILERGETPFLHVYAGNTAAIAVYERLGFRLRKVMAMQVLARA